jgi:hypothetical protein
MKKLILMLLGMFLFLACSKEAHVEVDEFQECRDAISTYSAENADPISGLIEGDIIPDMEVVVEKSYNKAYINANLKNGNSKLWTNNIVPFILHESLTEEKKDQIRNRIRYIESVTFLNFIEFYSETTLMDEYSNGIRFRAPINPFAGNSSHVGMQQGIQNLTLVGSSSDFVIEHEIFHALGHEHEHTRPDRDDYIIVHYDNIPINPTLRRQFDIKEGGIPCGEYDVTSGMHYGSKNGRTIEADEKDLPAITTIDGEWIPTPTGMSEKDIEANRILYPEIK